MKRYYVVFSGNVQGVGFRWTIKNVANKLGYTGWVRNMDNGHVEAEIQGEDVSFALLIETIQNNSYWIKITDYSCKEIPIEEHEHSFEVI